MYIVRLASAIATIYVLIQLAKEPENLEGLAHFGTDTIDDLFNWGNDRFVLGKLPEHGNATKRKKSHYDIFMEAILEEEEENKATTTEQAPETEEGPAHNEEEYGPIDEAKENTENPQDTKPKEDTAKVDEEL